MEGVFELLNSHNRKLTLDHLVENRKQNGVEQVQETEFVSEPKEKTVTDFKLTEGLGFIDIEVFEGTETCAVLGVYVAQSADSIPMFSGQPVGPMFLLSSWTWKKAMKPLLY